MFSASLLRSRTACLTRRTLFHRRQPYGSSTVLWKDDKGAAEATGTKTKSSEAASKIEADPPPTTGEGGQEGDEPKQYSYPELTRDAAIHKKHMLDPKRPEWENPLKYNNPEMEKIYREDFDSEEEFQKAMVPAPPLQPADGSVAAPHDIHELAEEILTLNMIEYNELVNKMADHYGFTEDFLAVDKEDEEGGDGGGDDDDDEEGAGKKEEKTSFDVKLVSFDAKAKIKIIKEVRGMMTGLGLKEAKALVDGAPCALQKDVSKETAEEMKGKLEELGAVIEIE